MAELLYGSSGDVRLELANASEEEISASLLNLGRQKATRLVDSFIEKAYPNQTPFTVSTDIPVLINTLVDDLSVYFIKRSLHPGPNPLSEDVKSEYYDKPMEILKFIRDGELEIPELSGKQGDSVISSQSAYNPTFQEDSELGWKVDSNKESDIDNSRS